MCTTLQEVAERADIITCCYCGVRQMIHPGAVVPQHRMEELAERRLRVKPDSSIVAAGRYHTVGLRTDGTVVTAGSNQYGQCYTEDWHDIVVVSASEHHTVGLKADGTVVAGGYIHYNISRSGRWKNIVAISAGDLHALGLKADGKVLAVGSHEKSRCRVNEWYDIVAVSAGFAHSAALRADGAVLTTNYGIIDGWHDIVAISAGNDDTMGLRADGTVCRVNGSPLDWTGIVEISQSLCGTHVVGLRTDGTVIACGSNEYGQCNTSRWNGIIAISAGYEHTAGVRTNGNVYSVGRHDDEQSYTGWWSRIGQADRYQMLVANERIELEARHRSREWDRRGRCTKCGGLLGGYFKKVCLDCQKPYQPAK